MRILMLGATGYIGSAVLDEMTAGGHSVLALARSDTAARQLAAKGADILRGDMRKPAEWSDTVRTVDAVIHTAVTFTDDMGDVDRQVLNALVSSQMQAARPVRLIYTGGCWLYGETGDRVATEESPFDPLPAFSWMIANSNALLREPCFETVVVHPAMVYDRDGGAVARFISNASDDGLIRVVGSPATRWPVVHRDDLAKAYRLALEQSAPGQSYNVAAEPGVAVGDIAHAVAGRLGVPAEPAVRSVSDAVEEFGDWAAGWALDQQMSSERAFADLGWKPLRTSILDEVG